MNSNLPQSKILESVEELPCDLRAKLRPWLRKRRQRYGSTAFGKLFPRLRVDGHQAQFMLRLHKAGMSFRAIEDAMRLIPNNGMNSYRVVQRAKHDNYRLAAMRRSRS